MTTYYIPTKSAGTILQPGTATSRDLDTVTSLTASPVNGGHTFVDGFGAWESVAGLAPFAMLYSYLGEGVRVFQATGTPAGLGELSYPVSGWDLQGFFALTRTDSMSEKLVLGFPCPSRRTACWSIFQNWNYDPARPSARTRPRWRPWKPHQNS